MYGRQGVFTVLLQQVSRSLSDCHHLKSLGVTVQADILQSFLDTFYDASSRESSTNYSLSDQKKTLLLMHILILGLKMYNHLLGPRPCEQLRQAVKIAPTQLTLLYR